MLSSVTFLHLWQGRFLHLLTHFLSFCSGLKLEADGSRVQVALKHLFSPHHVNSVEREAAILKDVSGRGYTMPFYDMFKEQPGNLMAGTPHTAQTAWLVTGYAKQHAAAFAIVTVSMQIVQLHRPMQ